MGGVILCETCGILVSRANISRHRRSHGVRACQRCIGTVIKVNKLNDRVGQLWFTMYQEIIIAWDILEHMKCSFSEWSQDEEELWAQYHASIYCLELTWLFESPMLFSIYNYIKFYNKKF